MKSFLRNYMVPSVSESETLKGMFWNKHEKCWWKCFIVNYFTGVSWFFLL